MIIYNNSLVMAIVKDLMNHFKAKKNIKGKIIRLRLARKARSCYGEDMIDKIS